MRRRGIFRRPSRNRPGMPLNGVRLNLGKVWREGRRPVIPQPGSKAQVSGLEGRRPERLRWKERKVDPRCQFPMGDAGNAALSRPFRLPSAAPINPALPGWAMAFPHRWCVQDRETFSYGLEQFLHLWRRVARPNSPPDNGLSANFCFFPHNVRVFRCHTNADTCRTWQLTRTIMAENKKHEKATKGTRMAEEIRAKANKLSDSQRQSLMGAAMAMIYRDGQSQAVRVHRS